ncbi:hypothetical protein C6501_09640 [Candidatus Poribacteria bacterium]|nr:MAG: hypothetical protein C6501_09640 [Candidatus Poribacteria bacterium]
MPTGIHTVDFFLTSPKDLIYFFIFMKFVLQGSNLGYVRKKNIYLKFDATLFLLVRNFKTEVLNA